MNLRQKLRDSIALTKCGHWRQNGRAWGRMLPCATPGCTEGRPGPDIAVEFPAGTFVSYTRKHLTRADGSIAHYWTEVTPPENVSFIALGKR